MTVSDPSVTDKYYKHLLPAMQRRGWTYQGGKWVTPGGNGSYSSEEIARRLYARRKSGGGAAPSVEPPTGRTTVGTVSPGGSQGPRRIIQTYDRPGGTPSYSVETPNGYGTRVTPGEVSVRPDHGLPVNVGGKNYFYRNGKLHPESQGQTTTSRTTGRQRTVYGDKLTLGRTTFDRYGNVDRTGGRYAQGTWRRV